MSESAEKAATPGDALPDPGIHPGSSNDDVTKGYPNTNSPSQILLEALQNFVIPLIHAANEKNTQHISQVHLGLEAGKLLTALQEFISSIITQSRVGQPQEVDLEGSALPQQYSSRIVVIDLAIGVDNIPENFARAESPTSNETTDRIVSYDTGPFGFPSIEEASIHLGVPPEVLQAKLKAMDAAITVRYRSVMAKIPEVVRERVFSTMPIRVLRFIETPRESGSKLNITLLDRNGVCGQVIDDIQADYSERKFRESLKLIDFETGFNSLEDITDDEKDDIIIRDLVREKTKYAILSHTWLRGSDSEVTYGAWLIGQVDIQKPGYQKLVNFCKSAWKDHRLSFGWMDTVCINKDSSSELDESIRSMYKWYEHSANCITYLAETDTLDNMYRDPWFTRGWTFQELLAPDHMSFYSKDWKKFVPYTDSGDIHNPDILNQICKATTITEDELRFPTRMRISRKMQLAARRAVTREEDTTYSLMGICEISISIAYGEGAHRAFFRLVTEILNSSPNVANIFNCAQSEYAIIPFAPSDYLHCSKAIMGMWHPPPIEPLLLTRVGLRIPILLMPSLKYDDLCLQNDYIGDYYSTLHLTDLTVSNPMDVGFYRILDSGVARRTRSSDRIYRRRTFGIMNFGGDTTSISVPDLCLAVCFDDSDSQSRQVKWDSTSFETRRISTKEPIVFHLRNRRIPTSGDGKHLYSLKRSELVKHGMTLTTMYLKYL